MESTGTSGGMRPRCPFGRAWTTTLFYVAFLGSIGLLNSQSRAQEACGMTTATPLRVENAAGVDMLRAAANCAGGGSLQADWAGAITLDTPISIASGMSLSITGEDTLAEVRGGYQTRMFEVFPGGRLTLTQLKLSGGNETGGGAIYSNTSALILDSCVFHDNVATDGNGGAVWAYGGNVTILGGEFLDNNASLYGGAVAATGIISSSLVVEEGSTFRGNKALVGGALYCSGGAESVLLARCSLSDTLFTSNTATRHTEETVARSGPSSEGVDGGGAVAFVFVEADITDSVFVGNNAQSSGGAVLGGNGTDITVNGCKFENNSAVEFGGAIAAASMNLGGNTQLSYNSADGDGGAVVGWDPAGAIIFNAVNCTQNTAIEFGGCFRGAGKNVVNDGTFMYGNHATHGGCIYAHEGSELEVAGGDFMCESRRKAGFLMIGDDVLVTITGGLFAHNVAGDRGGAVYCSGRGQSNLTIDGGMFRDNTANEYGGAISAWGLSTLVQVTGGTFANNTAKFNGGFVYLDGVGNFMCEGASVYDNYAGDQGGGIYAQGSTWVNSSCDLIANQALQGSAIYLTSVKNATLQNLTLTTYLALGGGMLYMTESSVVANGVSFLSGGVLQEDSPSRAIQSDGNSALSANGCVFGGWLSDTVIYHRSSAVDSLSLDSCDFRSSSTIMAAFSLNSDANIRNAVVGDNTFANTGRLNNSLPLVNRATDCNTPNICGPGNCVDSTLGVLCECLDADNCLNDGGELSLVVETPPASATYSPDRVSFELVVSSAVDGTTYAIWDLAFEAKYLDLDVAPSSGVLPPGGNITVVVTGAAVTQGVSGNLTSIFNLTSVGSASWKSTAGVTLEVDSPFYLCSAFKYANPLAVEDGDFSCVSCISISGGTGVDCTSPGATLTTLPLRQGYWRSGRESLVVHKCGHSMACAGATEVLSADDYCADGYQGPYCAVCSKGYGRGIGYTCHSCDNTKNQRLIWAGVSAFGVVLLLLTILGVLFLVGGLDAVDTVRKSVRRSMSMKNSVSRVWSVSQMNLQELDHPERRAREDYSTHTFAPAYDVTRESRHGAGERDIGHRSRESPPASPGPDDAGGTYVRPSVRPGVRFAVSDVPTRHATDAETPAGPRVRLGTNNERKSNGCGLGAKIKAWASRLPLHKLKILVVVWQILTVFATITDVEFPESYSKLLAWMDVMNFNMGHIFSASCILPSVNFYTSLLVTTLTPLALVAVLLLTYQMAKRRAVTGPAGVFARRAAWSRHVGAGLLLTYLVFTSASTLVFKTFACDDAAVHGKSFLRADYSISCQSRWHVFFICYAGLMILVYPIGTPVLYAVMLWRKRELLNPRIQTAVMLEPEEKDGAPTAADPVVRAGLVSSFGRAASAGQSNNELSPQELKEFNERVKARRGHPDLAASLFLWKDYGPHLFYYEVVECGRRILLTGVLIFISPSSSTQVAAACLFAFGALLGFELLRPHLAPGDTWLYRLGSVVIFLSYFLALLIDVDAAGEDGRSALADLLVAVNVVLVLFVFISPWCTLQPRRAAIGG